MSEKTPEERAKQINLAMLIHNGISEENAGFDIVTTINDKGLAIIAQAIREAENAAYERAALAVGPWITRLSRTEAEEAAAAIRALYHQTA